jgi:peptidoglycan/LPS O-acetylase OafA/YrhL
MLESEAIFKFLGLEWLNMRETVLDSIYTLAFIFAFLAFTDSPLPWKNPTCDLGVKSFGIYLTHIPAMDYAAKAIYWFAPQLLGTQILFQPIILVVGLGSPLLLIYLVEKTSLRRYYTYLFG